MMNVTIGWLDKYGVKYHEFSLSGNKYDSILMYNGINPNRPVKIVVDDSLDVLETMDSSIYSVAWSQPWNAGFYPRMWYDAETMRVLLQHSREEYPVGAWELAK